MEAIEWKFGATTFVCNADFTGDVEIHSPRPYEQDPQSDRCFLNVPIEDILAFAAEYVRMERTRQIDEATVCHLLSTVWPIDAAQLEKRPQRELMG